MNFYDKSWAIKCQYRTLDIEVRKIDNKNTNMDSSSTSQWLQKSFHCTQKYAKYFIGT
jgi:hypothetical protein